MKTPTRTLIRKLGWIALALHGSLATSFAASSALLGWNNLGMHCMDSDYSVFSILPPYNTIEAQLIFNGRLVTSGSGFTITYEAVADPTGSINSTSIGKGNFYAFTASLYGPVEPDMGLAGWGMPGISNTPQGMFFETNNSPAPGVSTPVNWFRAEGIPISPFDDTMNRNEYPLMRLVARDSANAVVAVSDVVLPVSDEMDCRACHGSGTQAAAEPAAGWTFDPNPERDYRLNILRLHDDLQFMAHPEKYKAALAAGGFDASGLFANVTSSGRPILCAACHVSEALPGSGIADIPPLTTAIHGTHADVVDPISQRTLNDSANRAACYLCHPGSTTQCLRGAMGRAIADDGSMKMQCQSCHGSMSQVGSSNRVGWFMEPSCQSCHTGTATHNNGQIRFATVFTDVAGTVRVPVDQTFATTPDTPAPGLSLYRFSVGHGGLQCSACHGSTHAEFPTAFGNDNIISQQVQGHAGVIAECTSCHVTMPNTVSGGPHGMHPTGQNWVSEHHDAVGNGGGPSRCQACHGSDYRGTVLSLMQSSRTVNGQALFRGAIVGCYLCHNGPSSSTRNSSAPPSVSDVSAGTVAGQSVSVALPVTGTNATLRIISQAMNGSVGLVDNVATYYPAPGFVGVDTFTFAAYDGSKNSNLATGTITVGDTPPVAPAIALQPVSQTVTGGATVTFSIVATGTAPLNYQWQKNTVSIPGANSATLVLNSVSTADAGNYAVVVSNVAGSETSASALLTVNPPPVAPTITLQPVSQTATAGATVMFTVAATGTAPLSYQWQKNGVVIPGGNSATLTLNSVSTADAGNYAVVVSNVAGSATSANASLTVTAVLSTIGITSPVDGATYKKSANLQINVSVSPAGSITQVQFFDGTTLLGSDGSEPFSIRARISGSGVHVLTAKGTTPSGAVVTSAPVRITIR